MGPDDSGVVLQPVSVVDVSAPGDQSIDAEITAALQNTAPGAENPMDPPGSPGRRGSRSFKTMLVELHMTNLPKMAVNSAGSVKSRDEQISTLGLWFSAIASFPPLMSTLALTAIALTPSLRNDEGNDNVLWGIFIFFVVAAVAAVVNSFYHSLGKPYRNFTDPDGTQHVGGAVFKILPADTPLDTTDFRHRVDMDNMALTQAFNVIRMVPEICIMVTDIMLAIRIETNDDSEHNLLTLEIIFFTWATLEAFVGAMFSPWLTPSYNIAYKLLCWWHGGPDRIPMVPIERTHFEFQLLLAQIVITPGYAVVIIHEILDINVTSTWMCPLASSILMIMVILVTSIGGA